MTTAEQQAFGKGFETLADETQIDHLEVQGEVPAWLSGTLIRNGPAQFEVGPDRFRHWFDGAAMLHRFALHKGRVSYLNRYLRTPAYVGNNAAGRITHGDFATDPCRALYKNTASEFAPGEPGVNANVNVVKVAEQYLAMTETPLPVAFDAETLETVGVTGFDDAVSAQATTAHPHYDPDRRAAVNHLIHYGRESKYSFAFIPDEPPLRREVISEIPVAEPGYVHSFGMTENFLILAEFPLVVNPRDLLARAKPFIDNFVWKPERGARFFVVAKADGQLRRVHKADAFFSFHHINAFEDGPDIVLDISAWRDARIVDDLMLENLRGTYGGEVALPEVRRYRLTEGEEHAAYRVLGQHPIDLPRINYARNGRPYRYAYGIGAQTEAAPDFFNAVVKLDAETDTSTLWYEAGFYPGEPVFVASPGATSEDDGVVLSVVLDGHEGRSFLLVLDARTFEERARALVPHHIPFGFHGQFFQK